MLPPTADSGPAPFFHSANDLPASATSTLGTIITTTSIAAAATTTRRPSNSGNTSAVVSRGPARSPHNNGQSSDSSRDRVGDVEDQRTKKRRTGPSSRGVANLTPEQLAKKRANDREAQRAIRERTRNQIETLENRIRELTSQQPYQELQAVLRAKEAVEAENAEIKSRLASVMSLIQPILQVEGAFTSSSPFPNFTPTQPTTSQPSPSVATTYNASTPASDTSPAASVADPSWHSQGQTQPSPNFTQIKLFGQQRLHNLNLGGIEGEQLKLDFLLDPSQRVNRMQTGVNGAQDTPEYQHLPMKHDWNAATSFTPASGYAATNGGPPPQQQQRIEYAPQDELLNPDASWVGISAPIKNGPPTCPLDNLLLDFLHERRQRAAEGVPTREVVGPRYPSVSSLLNPASSAFSHPLSKVFTDILAAFPGINGLPERVAVLYYMFLVMRWQVSPTRENYNMLPPFAIPIPAQLTNPHPAWVDHLPFPRMREKLARECYVSDDGDDGDDAECLFENFFIPFTTTVSLNWPYEQTDALLQSPDGRELLINPVFERHLRRLENWSLGVAFDAAFPGLRGTYNLKRGDGQFNGG